MRQEFSASLKSLFQGGGDNTPTTQEEVGRKRAAKGLEGSWEGGRKGREQGGVAHK